MREHYYQEKPEKNWSWYELSEMTAVCLAVENIKEKKIINLM